jgi:anaerobic magnesium-protoporphyrin IX monomethyl ester cyclase
MDFIKPSSNILLIEPPFYRFFGYQRWYYPVTLTLLGTYLEERGYAVRIYDADRPTPQCRPLARGEVRKNYHLYEKALSNEAHPIWSEVRNTLVKYAPDVIGITSITPKIESAVIVAKMAKELFGKNVTTMLGGPHVQGMCKSHPGYDFGPHFDHVVTRIPNLVDRKPNKKLILDYEKYSAENLSSMMTSSGCPNSCAFCCHSFEKRIIRRDIINLRTEIEEIKEWFGGVGPITTMDDCFFSNKKHFDAVIALFKENNLAFNVGSRVMALSPEKIDAFIKHGGNHLYIGVESGSQKILDRVGKRLEIEETIKRTKWLTEAGVPWQAFFIIGFPFETLDDLKMSVDIVDKIKPTFVSLNRFTPYPGTKIYDDYYKKYSLNFRDLFQLNNKSVVQLPEEMEEYINYMYSVFDKYNNDSNLR